MRLSHCVLGSLKVTFLQLSPITKIFVQEQIYFKRSNKVQVVRAAICMAINYSIHHILAEQLHLPVVSDVAGSESSSAASREAESKCSLSESRDSPSITEPLA